MLIAIHICFVLSKAVCLVRLLENQNLCAVCGNGFVIQNILLEFVHLTASRVALVSLLILLSVQREQRW